MDVRALFSSVLGAFGASAVVTRPGAAPITTQVVWLPPTPEELPAGMDLQALSMRKVLAIPRATVPTCPTGTIVSVAEIDGGVAKRFKVDGVVHHEADHVRVLLIPA